MDRIKWSQSLANKLVTRVINGKTWEDIGKEYRKDPSTLRRKVLGLCSPDLADQYRKKPKHNPNPPKNKWTESGDEATAEIARRNEPITLEEMIELFSVDLDVWEPVDFVANYWDMTNREGVAYRNYQGKAKFKRIAVEFDIDQAIGDFIAQAREHVPKYSPPRRPQTGPDPLLLEINIFDLHLAKYSSAAETGAANNLEIASRTFNNLLDGVIARVGQEQIERILFPIGNDFFHVDNHRNTTTWGTPQDTAGRWQESYSLGQRLLVRAIDRLREVAPVDVVVIPGNHDVERMYYVGAALALKFENCSGVTIDNGPSSRKYYRHGRVLIGYSHGGRDGPKTGDLHNIMAQERPEDWGQTVHREWHLGHIHITRKIEYMTTDQKTGVVIRHLRSPTPPDSWHHERGFIASGGGIDAFLWDREKGLTAILKQNL